MDMQTEKQKIGKTGENLACKFLVKHRFSIIERNYLKKYGEIDIIAKKDGILHFIEVKTVSRENISHETINDYRPEDNIHMHKLKSIARTMQTYLLDKEYDGEWKFHVITVLLDQIRKKAKITMIRNIIL